MTYFVDISRLVEILHFKTPTGIDRVEMAYAKHFLKRAEREDVRFVVTWPNFSGVMFPSEIAPLLEKIEHKWVQSRDEATFKSLRRALADPFDYSRPCSLRIGKPDDRRSGTDWVDFAQVYLRSWKRRISAGDLQEWRRRGAFYIHVSQFRLNRPERFAWVKQCDAKALFLIHDLIPILHPEYCRPGESERHDARIDTALQNASRIVTVSEYTRRMLEQYAARKRLPLSHGAIITLGLTPQTGMPPVKSDIPYFVMIGTIEPRKNLLFLLTMWHRFTQQDCSPSARLVLVGRRGWENENILDILDRSKGLASSVIEVGALGDAAMTSLLRGAIALVAPSFVEGYGLPIAEALSLGVPVIASDNEAHREAGGDAAEYLDPLDGKGWIQAFENFLDPASYRRQAALGRVASYRPMTWERHFAKLDEILG